VSAVSTVVTFVGCRRLLTWRTMERRTVQLRVAGQTYRVVTTANEVDLKGLVALVEQKLAEVTPAGRPLTPQSMLLAAMAFAHDLHEERERSRRVEARAKETLAQLLERIDAALEEEPATAAAATPAPPPLTP
jgi:cell division protein ZapA